MLVIEAPVFWAFCKAHNISLRDLDASGYRGHGPKR
jgi:hypothetical protein